MPAGHAVTLVLVHGTHVFDAASHAGVVPEQSVSAWHCTHLSWFAPELAQTPERHTAIPLPASPVAHVPSPVA
jgi:hypothetical protein